MIASKVERVLPRSVTVAGIAVPAGRRRVLEIPAGRLVTGTEMAIPAAVVNGRRPGPRVWLTGAVHGDELNGVEIVRRVLDRLSPAVLAGCLVAVPIVNIFGFMEGSRYLPDRRDLNRSFPGSHRGSLAGRLARLIMDHVVADGDVGIDFHTGTWHRANVPHVRTDLDDPEGRKLAEAFGAPLMLHARERDGSIRAAAKTLGKPVLVVEGGEAFRFDAEAIDVGVTGTLRVLQFLGMVEGAPVSTATPTELRSSAWVRARRSGVFRLQTGPGERIDAGETLGEIGDTLGGRPTRVRAVAPGWVIGVQRNPLVNRGDALVNIGYEEE